MISLVEWSQETIVVVNFLLPSIASVSHSPSKALAALKSFNQKLRRTSILPHLLYFESCLP